MFLPSAELLFRSATKLFTYSTMSDSPHPLSILWHIKSESVPCGVVTKLGKDFSSEAQVEFVCSAKWAAFGSRAVANYQKSNLITVRLAHEYKIVFFTLQRAGMTLGMGQNFFLVVWSNDCLVRYR